jgi:hypothetical protein
VEQDQKLVWEVVRMRIPDSTRRFLLAQATGALHELLRDESIDHAVFDQIEGAQTELLDAYVKMARWAEVTA